MCKKYKLDIKEKHKYFLFDGDIESAVKAYNAGPARVRAGIEPESTKSYWDKIRRDMIEYQMTYRRYVLAFKEANYGKSYF